MKQLILKSIINKGKQNSQWNSSLSLAALLETFIKNTLLGTDKDASGGF